MPLPSPRIVLPRVPLLLALLAGCGPVPVSGGVSAGAQGVAVLCLDPEVAAPGGAAVCGAPATIECGEPYPPLYVQAPVVAFCDSARLVATPTALALGPNVVEVRNAADADALVCSSTVTVVDRRPPAVEGAVLPLWPPNHRMETVRAADCVRVRDACDDAPRVEFTWGQVDEPDDATGDGHTAGDVRFDGCGAVAVRAERRGNGDGRVYSLGVRVTDRSGNATDAVCHVVVAHDASGRPAVEDAPARHVAAPAECLD